MGNRLVFCKYEYTVVQKIEALVWYSTIAPNTKSAERRECWECLTLRIPNDAILFSSSFKILHFLFHFVKTLLDICRHRRQICHRCCWHRWQIIRTISGCRHLKVSLKAKMFIYVNSTTQRCSNKIIKIFLLEDFFHLPPVSLTPVVHLEPRISPRIFEKIRNGRNGILRCLGETDSWKKPEVENLVTLSL